MAKLKLVVLSLLGYLALGADSPWEKEVAQVTISAYCPCSICCGPNASGVTKSRRSAWLPGVAVNPNHIPLGSHLDIPKYPRKRGRWIRADDTGRVMEEHDDPDDQWIDVRFDNHQQALAWGVKRNQTVNIWRKR